MFTNTLFSSQTFGSYSVAGTQVADNNPYQSMECRLDEMQYMLEQYAMRSHAQPSQHGYNAYSGMSQSEWNGCMDQGYGGIEPSQHSYFQQQFQPPPPPLYQQNLQPLQQQETYDLQYQQPPASLVPPSISEPPWQEMMRTIMESQKRTSDALLEMTNDMIKLQNSWSQQSSSSQIPDVLPSFEQGSDASQQGTIHMDETPQEELVEGTFDVPCIPLVNSNNSDCGEVTDSVDADNVSDSISDIIHSEVLVGEFQHPTHVDDLESSSSISEDFADTIEFTNSCKVVDTAKNASMVEMLATEVVSCAQPPPLERQPLLLTLESPLPEHLLERNEYAILETDAQLRALCALYGELAKTSWELGDSMSQWKASFGNTHSFPLEVRCFASVRLGRSFKASKNALSSSTLGPRKPNSFKARGMIRTLWDPGEMKRHKPWWEFLDQFKHKPP